MTNSNNTRAITVALKNVTLDHVRVGQAYTPSFAEGNDVPQWSLMVRAAETSESFEVLLDLKEVGLPVKLEESGELSLNLKQYTKTLSGKENVVNVFDNEFNELDEDTRGTIGNGSVGHVAFYYYGYANANGVGHTARLTDVVLEEKVEYTPETKEDRMKRLFG